jgi:hypothetical protein
MGGRFLVGLMLSLVAAEAWAGPYSSAVLADSPFAYWRLDETSGSVAVDASGNGRNGAYVGTPALDQSGPLAEAANNAVRFTASSSQYVTVPHVFGGAGWAQVTVEAWINVSAATSDFQAIISAVGAEFVHFQAFGAGNNVVYGTNGVGFTGIGAYFTPKQELSALIVGDSEGVSATHDVDFRALAVAGCRLFVVDDVDSLGSKKIAGRAGVGSVFVYFDP